jgi:hypothetical protein
MKRLLSDTEKKVISRVAENLPEGQRRQLLDDLANASAESATPDGARTVFDISGYDRPLYQGQHSFGIEGELLDKDGANISFDLYADENGRLLELELIRWDGKALIDPNWNTLKLYA